ncbi:MAG: tRNA (adenosine(37)-N6)-threonylcarbamoyltransferase complex dimerization subunit type 1 TsaB [Rhizobiales bacterium]|nr:tRNA (adenosine(37)-N6)-threonylcarbamoyltransferase complex dimerization subunit type 1 TsaB [Hyphomicrobiales bacterium]
MGYQLTLDTCTKACSVALLGLDGAAKQFSWFEILERGHAEILADKVQMLLKQAGISASEISQIAVTIGPGTFTGARIALSFARMFASARKIPVIAVNSLQATAFNAIAQLNLTSNNNIYVAMDARRGQVYFAGYNSQGTEILAPKAVEISEAILLINEDVILLGTGRALLLDHLPNFKELHLLTENMQFPDAGIFATFVKNYPHAENKVSPLYLRAADAKLPSSHPITFTQ